MKNLRYLIILLPFWIVSCNTTPVEIVEDTYADSTVRTIRYYKNESKEILLKEVLFYENGQKKMEGAFKDGERTGQWSYWYPDGKLWSQAVYKAGKENGLSSVWHKNGQKYYEGNIEMGVRKGVWKFWDEKGNLGKEIDYDNLK